MNGVNSRSVFVFVLTKDIIMLNTVDITPVLIKSNWLKYVGSQPAVSTNRN